ncbi:MAG TPA: hypothetical protein VIX89_07905 [Bryobacteraceae bacterium]
MRQTRVHLKRRLISPFRMNGEPHRRPNRLKYVDSDTTALGSTGFDNAQELLAKFYRFLRLRFKVD